MDDGNELRPTPSIDDFQESLPPPVTTKLTDYESKYSPLERTAVVTGQ